MSQLYTTTPAPYNTAGDFALADTIVLHPVVATAWGCTFQSHAAVGLPSAKIQPTGTIGATRGSSRSLARRC